MSANSRLIAIQIIGERKAFYRQIIPESSCGRKDQNNEQTSFENNEVEPGEPVQMDIYQNNIYREDLSWLHFDDEPRVQERVQGRQQRKDQQSYISVFVAYQTIPSSNQEHQPKNDNSIPCMDVWQIYRDTEQPQKKENSQNESKLVYLTCTTFTNFFIILYN